MFIKKGIKTISGFLCICIMMSVMLSLFPTIVSAHDSAHISATIDDKALKYNVSLVEDKPGMSKESNHIEARTARFDKIFSLYANDVTTDGAGTDKNKIASNMSNPFVNLTLNDTDDLNFFKALELGVSPGSSTKDLKGSPTDSVIAARDGVQIKGKSIFKDVVGDGKTVPDAGKGGMVFDFPTKEEGGIAFVDGAGMSEADYNRAFEVSTTLMTNLNGMLSIINGGQKYKDTDTLIKAAIYTRPKKDGNFYYTTIPGANGINYWILYGVDIKETAGLPEASQNKVGDATASAKNNNKYAQPATVAGAKAYLADMREADKDGNLLVHVIQEQDSILTPQNDATFVYAIQKGYVPVNGVSKITNSYTFKDSGVDVLWLTIHHIAFQANYNFSIKNITALSASNLNQEDVGVIDGMIAGLFRSIISGIKSVLGLYDLSELVYNQGLRGSQLYNEGTMSSDWWSVVLRYHIIFQVIAWAVIIIAVLKVLIQLNLSTINPQVRMSIMEIIQKFIIVGFFLAVCIPFIRMLISINNAIVGIFATQVDLKTWSTVNTGGNILVSLLIQFVYLGIFIYMNFIYIMRSIMIALLTAAAPIFIVTMAFSLKGKGLFDNWLKELTANIFLQGFHAFALAFLLNVVGVSRGIEQLVVAMALIPLTDWIRTQFFGHSGQGAGQIGGKFANMATQLGTSAIKGGIGAVTEKIGGNNKQSNGGQEVNGLEASNGVRETKNSQTLSDSIKSRKSSVGLQRIGEGALDIGKSLAAEGSKVVGGLAEASMGVSLDNQQMIHSGTNTAGRAFGKGAVDTAVGAGKVAIGTVETAGQAISAAAGGIAGAGAAGSGSSVGASGMLQASNGMSAVTSNPQSMNTIAQAGYKVRNLDNGTSQMVTRSQGNGYSIRPSGNGSGLSTTVDLSEKGHVNPNVPDFLINKQVLQDSINKWNSSSSTQESRQKLQTYMSDMGYSKFNVDNQNRKVSFETNRNFSDTNKISNIAQTRNGNILLNMNKVFS